jgi:hypothetical protein
MGRHRDRPLRCGSGLFTKPAMRFLLPYFLDAYETLLKKLPVETNSQEVDLTQINPVWVQILINEAMGDVVSINNQKIIDILEAAIYFGIDSIFKRWDNYIFEQQLLPKVLVQWKKTNPAAINVDINAPI